MRKHWLLLIFLAGHAFLAQAACPTWATADRFALNGNEVTDKRTGLVWARCLVGQVWQGNACIGSALSLQHEAALAHAANEGKWRLPTVKELHSLLDNGCINPAIDASVFPETPAYWHWSSTPYNSTGDGAWVVSFYDGQIQPSYRFGDGRHARLVKMN